MKHYLLFLLSLCACGALFAQNPVCEVVVWPTGYTNGQTTLTAFDSSSAQAVSYIWSTGANTSEIQVSSDGVYCVTVTYADGCTASDCDTLDNNDCSSFVYSWQNSDGSYTLNVGYYPGYLDAEYLWSNGQTSSQIQATQSGTYTVQVTLENGCTSTASILVTVLPPQCDLYIYQLDSIETGSVWLYATMWPNGVSYQWNTGDSTYYLEVTQPGTYCVSATNAFGCSESQCVTVNCGVDIEQTPAGQFTATSLFGTPPFTYSWADGSTTQTITPSVPGFYCVTVTDAQGCTSDDCMYYWGIVCNASIDYNSNNTLTANLTGTGPFVYEWSPGGYTTQTIAPTEDGYYYVTVTSANGCQAWTYQYWYSATACTVDVFQYTDSLPVSNAVWLSAQLQGNWADWHIEWSTGETYSTIMVTAGGEYCVSATNLINGCVATSCTWAQPDSACYVQINSLSLDPATLQLSAIGGPDPLSTYAWSTGETTPAISITENGHYGVTVTNTAGCTVSGYTFVYPANDLSVQVLLSDTLNIGNAGVFADIYLIQYDTAQGGILTAIDTVATYTWTNDWAFVQIQDIPAGQYLIKAALKPNSNGYDTHLPTYYEDALLWSDATPVTVNAISGFYSNNTVYINLVPGQNPGGAGFIGGLVNEGANLTGGGDEVESLGEGDPFQGASVVLTLQDGTPVATAVTGAGGQYSFENLAWGTYILTLDIPGLAPVSITVTIGPGQPSVTSANFKVDENSIALPVQEIVADKPVKVFPNPAHDMLTVELPAAAELTLTNVQGQVAQRTLENGAVARLSLRDLPAGIYFLTARMANSIQVLKVMIE